MIKLIRFYMRYIFVIFLLFISMHSSANKTTASIYGYVQDGNFHPILSIKKSQIIVLAGSHSNVPTAIEPMFVKSPLESIKVIRTETYKDIYNRNEVGSMGKVSKEELPVLFYKNIDLVDIESKDDEIQSMSFYSFFSKDNWGKHFISKAQLSLSIEDIAMETGVNIHAITDIDGNNRYEVWVSYELMYGEIGVMVYQKDESEEWTLVVNHCFMCD